MKELWYLNPAKPAGAPIQLQVSGQFLPPRYWDDGSVQTIRHNTNSVSDSRAGPRPFFAPTSQILHEPRKRYQGRFEAFEAAKSIA